MNVELLSVERMTEVMVESDKLEIRLANDPTVLGPAYLQDMIATCRNHTNKVVQFLNEVARARMVIDRDLRRRKTGFKIASDALLAQNHTVKALPNIKDREAQINLVLRDERKVIEGLENDLVDVTHVEDYVKRRHRELKDTMREIQVQRNLIQDDHSLGGMYGDERSKLTSLPSDEDRQRAYSSGGSASAPEGINEIELNSLIQGEVGTSQVAEEAAPSQEGAAPPQVVEEAAPSQEGAAPQETKAPEPMVASQEAKQPEVSTGETSPKTNEVASTDSSIKKSDDELMREFLGQGDQSPPSPGLNAPNSVVPDDDFESILNSL